ncbi:phosphatidylserine decarboxylase [Pelagibacteraceae bacterium]|jgi:phosphatidylserine decarboxylase|nr:phosphatidylserine decarboxylase [Pelagibacteraceae bacterium]MDC0340122.1 phosphatidylserine decarboxylase [Pelagibacteraceae bacterium]|tara:strand:- start:1942 stop:2601 length:660 start_codon:yes stop_codon:yes gene_type:complete
MLNTVFPKIHKEGYKFLAISIIVTFLVLFFSQTLGLILILITIWVYYFFRDPERYSINDDNFLVSPADGLITHISEQAGPMELQLENTTYTKISIFMNVFNCHVNRTPLTGTVEEIYYKPGKFLNASLDKASEENERNYYKIKNNNLGEEIIIVQIAGLIARRIVCEVEQGQDLKQGDRIGMIRFGSRVDIYFKNKKPLVRKGQNVIAGESLIAFNDGR